MWLQLGKEEAGAEGGRPRGGGGKPRGGSHWGRGASSHSDRSEWHGSRGRQSDAGWPGRNGVGWGSCHVTPGQ